MRNPDYFKKIADDYNRMTNYERFCHNETERGSFENIDKMIETAAKAGRYTTGILMAFRYDDPEKEYWVKYYKAMGYKNVELVELPNQSSDLKSVPYRSYNLILSWK